MKKSSKKFILVAGIIALSLMIIHFINTFIFYISTFKNHLFSDYGNYYNWRLGRVFYTKKGSGPVILLVHDLNNTSSHYEWKDVSDSLSKNYTVYTIDLIGCGNSDKPKMTYTSYLYVQLISDFIRDVIGESTSIVCSRNSCSISIMACHIDSSLFKKLILINPRDITTVNKYPTRKHRIIKFLLTLPIIGTLLYNINNSRYQLLKKFNKAYLSNSMSVSRYIKAYSEAAHTSGSNSLFIYSSIKCHYTCTNISHALQSITNDIRILEGSECNDAMEILDQYESINPSIETTLLINNKELPQIENPHQVISFIESNL